MSEEKKQSLLKRGIDYLRALVRRFNDYLHETWLEMKRSTWPDRRALVSHTVVVIVGVLLLGLYVGVSDWILENCLRWLVPRG
jgi:preprotein translocase SecE subunit